MSPYKVKIVRLYQTPISDPKQTEGILYLYDTSDNLIFHCKTLELPWRDNETSVSCIPADKYVMEYRKAEESGSFGYDHLIIKGVPGRSYILIHRGNYNWHVEGCILVGDDHKDINKDGLRDVLNSRNTMDKLMSFFDVGDEIDIEIVWRSEEWIK